MISTIRAGLLGLYLSGCAVVSSASVGPQENAHNVGVSVVSTQLVTGYAGSTALDSSVNDAFHGFKIGLRGESCFGVNQHNYRGSHEFSFRGLFGENRNFYEFGLNQGIKILGDNNHNLELLVGPARMGVASEGKKYWTPQAGLGYNLRPFQLQAGADFYVGKERGVGAFVNGGLGF